MFAQVLVIVAMPLLTRLYSPHHFDLLAIFTAVIAFASVAASLRFNVAVPLPADDATAADLLVLAMLSAACFSTIFGVAVFFYGDWISGVIGQPGLRPYLWLMPLGLLLAAVYDSMQYWATRQKRFGLVTKTRVTRAVGGVGVQLGIGVVTPSAFGLIFGQVLYYGLGVVGIARSVIRGDRAAFLSMSLERLVNTARAYQRYPKVSVPEAALNAAGAELPILLIAAVVTGPEAGHLMLAMRALGAPMALVGSSVAQVFFVTAPDKDREGRLHEFTSSTIWRLARWGGVPLLLIGVTAPSTFPTLFGNDWARAGEVAAWFTPCFVLQLLASPVSMVLHITGDLSLSARLQALGATLRIGAVAGAAITAPQLATEAFAVASAVYYGLYIIIILDVVKRRSSRHDCLSNK